MNSMSLALRRKRQLKQHVSYIHALLCLSSYPRCFNSMYVCICNVTNMVYSLVVASTHLLNIMNYVSLSLRRKGRLKQQASYIHALSCFVCHRNSVYVCICNVTNMVYSLVVASVHLLNVMLTCVVLTRARALSCFACHRIVIWFIRLLSPVHTCWMLWVLCPLRTLATHAHVLLCLLTAIVSYVPRLPSKSWWRSASSMPPIANASIEKLKFWSAFDIRMLCGSSRCVAACVRTSRCFCVRIRIYQSPAPITTHTHSYPYCGHAFPMKGIRRRVCTFVTFTRFTALKKAPMFFWLTKPRHFNCHLYHKN